MLTLIIVLIIIALIWGGWGYPRYGPGLSLSPLAILIIILLVLWLTGTVVITR